MKCISFTLEDFPQRNVGVFDLPFTEKALLRAVVAAGKKPNSTGRTRAARADAEMRRNAIISALDMSGDKLMCTPEFREAGSTDKATKSLHVGNALCTHSAYLQLKIPWLVDVENEKLAKSYKIGWNNTGKRPDFIGQATNGGWYVFESKGRITKPSRNDRDKWKVQAKSIGSVRGKKVSQHIISAAHLKKINKELREWELLWVDPPEQNEPINLDFEEFSFFYAYYEPIRELLDTGFLPIEVPEGLLFYIPTLGSYVGLHRVVLDALERRDASAVREFAGERSSFDIEEIENRSVSVYADGVMIALLQDLEVNQIRSLKALLHTREPGIRCWNEEE